MSHLLDLYKSGFT